MCTRKCSLCIAGGLYPLALISIICNIILFFPGLDVKYALNGQITEEVKKLGGLVGGGVLVLIPAVHIHMTGKHGCCANRCGMFLSFILAAVGVAGAIYSFIVALLGLLHGPYCNVLNDYWETPSEIEGESYLKHSHLWRMLCTEPKNVVEFNVVLFSILLVVNSLQIILCAIQMINGLFGCLCGTCRDSRHTNITVTSAVNVSL